MTEHDGERRLRDAFARLRAEEARGAPSLAPLLARAEAARRAPRAWRLALPLAGAAAAALVALLVARARAPQPEATDAALARLERSLAASPERAIALGSLRSPTDVLLAPPLSQRALPFSGSLIPLPPAARPAHDDRQSLSLPARRFPA